MQNALEQAYSAIERSYAEGGFPEALGQAMELQPQIEVGRADLLDQRLQLLIGHIHLYGLAEPQQAATAYQAVLAQCQKPAYRQLAEQGLALCAEQGDSAAPSSEAQPEQEERAVSAPIAATPSPDLPATPWLAQLHDPQQALAEIQQAWAPVTQTPQPEPLREESSGLAASPWGTAETAQPPPQKAASIPVAPAGTHKPKSESSAPELERDPAAERKTSELDKGLLLVRLSSLGAKQA
jgi:hypothetical protein